jgi:2-amino-4-hydroxy-6-hydroxymethyldihydropteridine diphosphokinase
MTVAYVGLGANLGDREGTIRRAAELIGARRLSAISETEPWGVTDQPPFLNAIAELEWDGQPRELLDRAALGRARAGPGPGRHALGPALDRPRPPRVRRRKRSTSPALTVPHPHLHQRLFALEPLAELAPELVVPGRGTVATLLSELQCFAVSHLDEPTTTRRARGFVSSGSTAPFTRSSALRADPGRHVSLQQARHAVRPAARLSVLRAEDGGRLGLGQEPARG